MYCKEHIEEGMVDVRHKHCMHPGCPKQATCNQPGAGGGMFCGQHKLEGMVNVVLKRCAHEGCETFPSFGHPGQPGVQYCRLHKLPGMTRRTSSSSAITFHPALVLGLPGTTSDASPTPYQAPCCSHNQGPRVLSAQCHVESPDLSLAV